MKYIIKEFWRVSNQIEKYETTLNSLKAVRDYIKDWIDSWKENAEENGYKFLYEKTDYKTFAKCKIETGVLFGDPLIDTFSVKVLPPLESK